jgi:hypothetical protein
MPNRSSIHPPKNLCSVNASGDIWDVGMFHRCVAPLPKLYPVTLPEHIEGCNGTRNVGRNRLTEVGNHSIFDY